MGCYEGKNSLKRKSTDSYKDSFMKGYLSGIGGLRGRIYAGVASIIIAPAIIGNIQINRDRNEKLEPLRLEFIAVAENKNYEEIVTENGNVILNYNGALDPIINAKNEFATYNDAHAFAWKAYKVTGGEEVQTKTPAPLTIEFIDAYKRFLTNEKQPVNTTSIDKYFTSKK